MRVCVCGQRSERHVLWVVSGMYNDRREINISKCSKHGALCGIDVNKRGVGVCVYCS